ncbi:nitroreductase family protein [bacterium]|nr:nitroreductase family protein [bacterium]
MMALLRERQSIRSYTDKPVDPGTIDLLKEALLLSPSSRGIRPWRFVFVDDRDLLGELSRVKPHGGAFLAKAPLGVVVCGSSDESDVWIEDCSIASTILHLTAHSLGLGSCWIQIRQRKHESGVSAESVVRDLLDLPESLHVLAIIAVGYPAGPLERAKPPEMEFGKIVHTR